MINLLDSIHAKNVVLAHVLQQQQQSRYICNDRQELKYMTISCDKILIIMLRLTRSKRKRYQTADSN